MDNKQFNGKLLVTVGAPKNHFEWQTPVTHDPAELEFQRMEHTFKSLSNDMYNIVYNDIHHDQNKCVIRDKHVI